MFPVELEIIVPLAITHKQSIHNLIPCRTPLKANNKKKNYTKALNYPEKKIMPILMMPVQWIDDKILFFFTQLHSLATYLQNTAMIVIPHFTLQYLLAALYSPRFGSACLYKGH